LGSSAPFYPAWVSVMLNNSSVRTLAIPSGALLVGCLPRWCRKFNTF